MKKETIIGIMSDFLDSIRAYEHESGSAITYDERDSSDFVNIFFGDVANFEKQMFNLKTNLI